MYYEKYKKKLTALLVEKGEDYFTWVILLAVFKRHN